MEWSYYLFLVVPKSNSKYCNAKPSQLLRIDRCFWHTIVRGLMRLRNGWVRLVISA